MTLEAVQELPVANDFEGALVETSGPTNARTNAPLTPVEKWIDAAAISLISGVAVRRIQKTIKARKWRGSELQVREIESNVGQGGKTYQVHVDSLPQDVREAWYDFHDIDLHAKPTAASKKMVDTEGHQLVADPFMEKARARAAFIRQTIAPALKFDGLRNLERRAFVNELAKQTLVFPDGSEMRPTSRTVYNWIKAYEEQGIHGLMRRKRADTGDQRLPITRAWDKCFRPHIKEAEYAQAAEEITAHMRGLWAGGAAGWRVVSEQSSTRLLEISRAFNVPAFERLPLGRLGDNNRTLSKFGLCWLPRRRVEKERSYSQIALKDRDNKLFEDKYAPAIRRDYSDLKPRDIVVGDVHPVDVKMLRADGTEVYPKAIAWFDPCTNEVHMTFALLEKGEGIRREHVAQSFGAMVEEWGLPSLLYLDNGSEYKWDEMINGFSMLTKLAGQAEGSTEATFKVAPQVDERVAKRLQADRPAVLRSIAYNAKGKPGIEGAFSVLEQVFFSSMQGWTAGDRMNKKTHQKGKEPNPFPGSAEEFLDQAAQALEWYHKRPQHGRLNGRSPNEVLRQFIEDGWGSTALNSPEVMALAFATTETRVVDRGRVQFTPRNTKQTIFYYHDDLLPLGGSKVELKIPAYDPQYVFVFYEGELVCLARPEEMYHPLDPRGAQEVARRRKVLSRHISEKRKSAALLSLVDDTARHLKHMPDAPEIPVAKTISVEALDQMRALQDQDRAQLMESLNSPKVVKPSVDQWGVDEAEFTKGVVFLDDDDEEETA